jgi:hypothetical protein
VTDVRSKLDAARARRRRNAMVIGSIAVAASLVLVFGALVASGALETDDEASPAIVGGATTTSTRAQPVRERAPTCGAQLTSADPLWLWIGGDSLAGTLGPSLGERAGATGVVQPIYDSRVSSGLSMPEFFDWPEHTTDPEAELVQLDPDIVVFMIGANDWRAVTSSSAWEAQYEQQVEEMLTILEGSRDDRHVYWVGSPILQEKRKDAGVQQVNAVARRVVEQHPHATYVDAYTLFADTEGKYAASLPDETGKVVRVRAGDGVHLTDAGGDRLAAPVFELLDQRCDVAAHAIEGSPKTVLQAEDSDGPSGDSGGSGTSTRSSGGTVATAPTTVETLPAPTAPPETTPETTPDTTPDTTPEPPVDPPVEPSLPT